MPKTRVVLYQEEDETAPLQTWLKEIPPKAALKCLASIELLKDLGHELRRPQADLLRDGIHELRVGFQGIHYRILYFFHGNVAAVVSHGLTKERAVPPREIGLAIKRRAKFLANPAKHTFEDK